MCFKIHVHCTAVTCWVVATNYNVDFVHYTYMYMVNTVPREEFQAFLSSPTTSQQTSCMYMCTYKIASLQGKSLSFVFKSSKFTSSIISSPNQHKTSTIRRFLIQWVFTQSVTYNRIGRATQTARIIQMATSLVVSKLVDTNWVYSSKFTLITIVPQWVAIVDFENL